MTVTIVETRAITGGVDTHAGVHVAAALERSAGCSACRSSRPARSGMRGYGPGWAASARSPWSGVEGTGSYGAGLARYLGAAGIRVVEVDRADRQDRRRQGKSDPLDAG